MRRRQGAFYRSLRADELDAPLAVTNKGAGAVQAVVSVSGSPTTPEPAAERGFKIERNYFTLDGEPADATDAKQNQRFVVVLKMTEPQPQFGRVIVADYLPAGFEIDNPRLVSSGDTGTLAWIANAAAPVNSEFRDDRFTAAFDRIRAVDAGVYGGLCGARGVAGQLRAAAGDGRGHVPARPFRAHRDGQDRGDGGKMKPWRLTLAALAGAAFLTALAGTAWVYSLGRPPLGQDLETSHVVLDRSGRLLRAYATSEGRWRLPATEKDVDPRFLELLFAYEDKRFYEHRGVDILALGRAAVSVRHQRAHRVGWLHPHHAGGAPAGAARAPQSRRQTAPDDARARARTRVEQKSNFVALSDACALRRQS